VRTIQTISEGQYFGIKELKEEICLPGRIISDEDKTTILVLSKDEMFNCITCCIILVLNLKEID